MQRPGGRERLIRAPSAFDPLGRPTVRPAEDDVRAIDQGTADRLVGRAASDHGLAGCQVFETAEIGPDGPGKFPLAPDDPVASDRGDENDQTETRPGIAGWGS